MSKKKYKNPLEILNCPKCSRDMFRQDSSKVKCLRTVYCKPCANAFNKREKDYKDPYWSMGDIEILRINDVLPKRSLNND